MKDLANDAMKQVAEAFKHDLELPPECSPFSVAEQAHLAGQCHAAKMIEAWHRQEAERLERVGNDTIRPRFHHSCKAWEDAAAHRKHADAIAQGEWLEAGASMKDRIGKEAKP